MDGLFHSCACVNSGAEHENLLLKVTIALFLSKSAFGKMSLTLLQAQRLG